VCILPPVWVVVKYQVGKRFPRKYRLRL
jgi:hypothetical protein